MKATKFILISSFSILFAGAAFISCKKESAKTDNTADLTTAENSNLSESNFNDVATLVDQAVLTGGINYRLANGASNLSQEGGLGSSCATISLDTVSSTHTLVIDFGSSNCVCNDGRSRRGKIMASFTGHYRNQGTVISIGFENYFVNDNQIKGTKTITNQGHNSAGHLVYAIEVNGQIIKANNGGTITWTSSRHREWIAGEETPALSDDIYSITGTASGTNAAGDAYTIAITSPLVRKMNCRWFESGSLNFTPAGKPSRSLDFGNTGCDANATVTVLGINFPVILP